MKKFSSVARALAFVSLAALMAGCKTTSPQTDTTDNIPNDYRLRHPIAVREKAQTLTVFIGDRRGGLTPTQRAEVGAIASSWRRDATGGVVIETPVGGTNAPAAHSASHEIRAILGAAGVPPQSVEIRPVPTQDPVRLGNIRVSYPKMAAETGPCGLWPEDLAPTTDKVYRTNRQYYNLGCATQRSLAAQVAEPADLVQPRSETPVLASRRNTVIDKYRKGEATATQYTDANKGKISDVGQ
ncbi:MAG: pilus assembly protein CpaD [Hyphomicrobiales bacterium]|jgi:pilus assembly protein CpaD